MRLADQAGPGDQPLLRRALPDQRTRFGPRAQTGIRQRKRGNLGCVVEPLPTGWWATRDVATFLNVAPSTIRASVARGRMPTADRRIGREPAWRPAPIPKWHG